MLLQLLVLSSLLWTGVDNSGKATINVSCDKVEIHYGGQPTANKIPVSFWFKDKTYGHTYRYVVTMYVGPIGEVILEPAGYWIEEIRLKEELKIKIRDNTYIFDLTGTSKAINCD